MWRKEYVFIEKASRGGREKGPWKGVGVYVWVQVARYTCGLSERDKNDARGDGWMS